MSKKNLGVMALPWAAEQLGKKSPAVEIVFSRTPDGYPVYDFQWDQRVNLAQRRHETFYLLWQIYLLMRAWGLPEYPAETVADPITVGVFKAIVAEDNASEAVYSFVRHLQTEALRCLGEKIRDDWLLELCGFDSVRGMPKAKRDALGRVLDEMLPVLKRLAVEEEAAGNGDATPLTLAKKNWPTSTEAAKAIDVDRPAPLEDGPIAPNILKRGEKQTTLAPIPFRMVDFLWRQPNKTAEVEAVIGAAWGEDASQNAVNAAKKKANEALSAVGFPLSVSTKNGQMTIG